jgi:phosphate transport system permease protein
MAVTDTNATERVEPEPAAAQDPSVSPVVDHGPVALHSPVPKVTRHAPAPSIDGQVNRAPRGVKLAKISKTGDRVFRALASTSGLTIILLVLFVGIFLLALALPSLRADQDNFLTSRNWTVAGNELRFGIAGLLWTTVLSSILAMAMERRPRSRSWSTCSRQCRRSSSGCGD